VQVIESHMVNISEQEIIVQMLEQIMSVVSVNVQSISSSESVSSSSSSVDSSSSFY
jgi:hypothetical protein